MDDSELKVSAVHVAGQIALVPSTMSLPSERCLSQLKGSEVTDADENNFTLYSLQAVLSLQHLWRIGMEMDVCWWTGAIAYLSSDSIPNLTIKAKLAAAAWAHQHESIKLEDTEDEDQDPWEERHHGRLGRRGGTEKVTKSLPQWSIVSTQDQALPYTPPFFAAEVQELPRASAIEWQASLGLTHGPIQVRNEALPPAFEPPHQLTAFQVSSHTKPRLGTIHRCTIVVGGEGEVEYLTLLLLYQAEMKLDEAVDAMSAAFGVSGLVSSSYGSGGGCHGSYASYLDVCVRGLWDGSGYGGVIPCRSLWDRDGNRLAAVLHYRLLSIR